ncbi:hypothetical protein [Deinococcus navajonensis]|uniref:Uncharacterized protein n=1 Tax=Deinococcus navajonensis TaxID=309884 RepID=A0ABV8XR51_9DEIO
MIVIMCATYPDVFSAIGVDAGLEYEAATSAAYTSMNSGGPKPILRAPLPTGPWAQSGAMCRPSCFRAPATTRCLPSTETR